jgi:hypothetical protein
VWNLLATTYWLLDAGVKVVKLHTFKTMRVSHTLRYARLMSEVILRLVMLRGLALPAWGTYQLLATSYLMREYPYIQDGLCNPYVRLLGP